ncbi:MAG TPA: hypothetical protein VE197_17515 [Mycobacterium sp.]|nr:hypothetical protein [Mycobacterium sp.]
MWLRIDHWLNVLFLTLIIRSGIEILGAHPKRIVERSHVFAAPFNLASPAVADKRR